jgi:hypothetical protein
MRKEWRRGCARRSLAREWRRSLADRELVVERQTLSQLNPLVHSDLGAGMNRRDHIPKGRKVPCGESSM